MTFPNVKTMQLSIDGKNILNIDLRLFLNGFIEMNPLSKILESEDKNLKSINRVFDLGIQINPQVTFFHDCVHRCKD